MVELAKDGSKRILQSRILRSSAALLISDSSSTAIGLVTSVVLTQKLGAEGLSLIFLAMAVVDTIKNFLDIRPEEGVIRFVGNAMALDQRSRAITFFYVGLVIDVLLMVATLVVVAISFGAAATVYPESETLRGLMGIYLLTIPLNGVQGTFAAVMHTFKRFNWLAIVTLTQRIVFLFYVIVQSDLNRVMWGYVLQEAIGFGLISGMGLWLLRKNIGTFRGERFWTSFREFIPFAFHTSLTASLKVLTTNIDVLILGAMRPLGEVAFFRIGRSAANLVVMPSQPIRTVIYPELNEAWAKRDLMRVRQLINKYIMASLLTGMGLFAVMAISADWLVQLIYPPEFAPVANILRILAVGLVLQSLFSWIRPAAMADNQPQLVTFYGVVTSLLYGPMMLIAIYYAGVIGAAVAFDVWMVASTLLFIFYVIPRLRLRLFEFAPKTS